MPRRTIWLMCLLIGVGPSASYASYHFTEIQQTIGGVKGHTQFQAIQLRALQANQDLLHLARMRAWDAQGQNPVLIVQFGSDVTNTDKGANTLIASPDFNAVTSPPAQPDYVMTNLIPDSYLTAGSLTFESLDGTIMWRISWGGASYTGPTTASKVNTPSGDFGTPFAGALPSSTLNSLLSLRSVGDFPNSTATDYALTSGAAVFVNNAGQQFTLVDGCPADPTKVVPGVCGCGTPDTDSDGDGRADCIDPCPENPADLPVDNCTPSERHLCGLGFLPVSSLAAIAFFIAKPMRRIRGDR